jgi:hypothetical protein
MQSEFYNQPVVDWAKQNLSRPVEIKLRFGSRWGKIFTYLLIFIVPLTFITIGVVLKLIGGVDPVSSNGALVCGFVLLIPFGIIALIGIFTQQKFVKSMERDGVKSSLGRKFVWSKLYYVDHVSKRHVSRKIEDNQLELVFENGKAIIPPLIHDRERIWSLINSMPVQVRDDGEIRQVGRPENAAQTPAFDDIVKAMGELKAEHDRNK